MKEVDAASNRIPSLMSSPHLGDYRTASFQVSWAFQQILASSPSMPFATLPPNLSFVILLPPPGIEGKRTFWEVGTTFKAKGSENPECVVGLFQVRLCISGPMEYMKAVGWGQRASKMMIDATARQGSRNKDGPADSAALTWIISPFWPLFTCVRKRTVHKLQIQGMKEETSLQILKTLNG